ncbi:CMP-N-acetylneuraminate-poly-alpha-2,8-sialyltransferase-like [Ptychodera flava]|uniref:CMP-N-acetylneuraminate-poly-alpha-2, 8-sialyltransferase-like n=1 Tax=Ptychodera flava TaxID=63121 RepID=UPI00396A7E90
MLITGRFASRQMLVFLFGFTTGFTGCMTAVLVLYVTMPMTQYYTVSQMKVYSVLSQAEDKTSGTRAFAGNGVAFQHVNNMSTGINSTTFSKALNFDTVSTSVNGTMDLKLLKKAEKLLSLNETRKLDSVNKTKARKMSVNESIKLVSDKNTTKSRSVKEHSKQVIYRVTYKSPVTPSTIFKSIRRDWKFNAKEARKLRDRLEKDCNTSEEFTVTQENVELNGTIPFDAETRESLNVSRDVYSRFPKEMPYKEKLFKNCSLVGNSGILLHSNCGKSIDSSDFVIRFNLARVRNYSKDTGSKTNLVTCNPSILTANYSSVNNTTGAAKLVSYMKREYGNATVYSAAFSYRRYAEPVFNAQDILEDANIKLYYVHSNYIASVKRFFKRERKIKEQRTSSGLLLLAGALSFCQEIHLYGYWPFPNDPHGKRLNYHYFDKYSWMTKKHDMPLEFKLLVDFHNRGILRLHVGKC